MSAASGVVELADDEEYADLDLSEVRPGDEPWRRRRFVRCRFAEADLRGLVTEGCSFDECDFTSADLGESAHRGTAFRTC
ncbi:MAG TPA: pentapeptide repeat-containing protein, partial [Pseudonocardia sp.]|nr:pentapeptide repeat-containing protein [Pseudonocardia sp.]